MKELFLVIYMGIALVYPCSNDTKSSEYLKNCKEYYVQTYFTSSLSDATAKSIEYKDDGVRVFRINHERTCNKELCFNTMSLNSTELELKELPRFELKEKR